MDTFRDEPQPFTLIDPKCKGICLEFRINFNWNGTAEMQLLNCTPTAEVHNFLKQAFAVIADNM